MASSVNRKSVKPLARALMVLLARVASFWFGRQLDLQEHLRGLQCRRV